jgi:hypothetical protein
VTSGWRTRIASQPLFPRETRVRSLRTGQDHVRCARLRGGGWRQAHLDALMSHELLTSAPVISAAPISPEQRCGTHPEWMQQHTHLARLRASAAIPLTRLAQRTRAAVANAGCIHHAQASIGFCALLVHHKRLMSRTAHCPIRLEQMRRQPARSAVGWREQTRSCAEESALPDAPAPDAGSTPTGSRYTMPLDRKRCDYTNDQGPALDARRLAQARRLHDAGTVRRYRKR